MPSTSRRSLFLALLAAAPIAAACHSSSAPRPTLDVVVSLVGAPRDSLTPPIEGISTHICDARLQASATGTGDAVWTGATLRFFGGSDETKIFDSSTVDAAQMARTWGGASIVAGSSFATTYRITAKIPFGAIIDFHYRQSGGRKERTARVPVHCAG